MRELRNNVDHEARFTDLTKAKKYYMPESAEFPEQKEYAVEISEVESLDELADVLNKYSDLFGNGSEYRAVEF